MFDEIAEGVFTAAHRIVEGKAAIVLGTERALAIDACIDPAEGTAMAAFIRTRGFRPELIAYTHGHPDHVLGSGAFAAATAVAHPLAVEQIRRTVARIAARDEIDPIALAGGIRWPNVLCDGELDLDLGERIVHLIPTPGHTADSICAYLPAEQILIGGDTVVTAIVPAITDGDSATMVATLEQLGSMSIDMVVPGHGSVVFGAAAVQECIEWEANYLRLARRVVADAGDRDAAVDELVRAVGDRLPPDRYRMTERHRNVVDKIAAELVER